MGSYVAITLVALSAAPADGELHRKTAVGYYSSTVSSHETFMLYGHTPTRWRRWNSVQSRVPIEGGLGAAAEPNTDELIEPIESTDSSDRVRWLEGSMEGFDDYSDQTHEAKTVGTESQTTHAPTQVPQSVPPGSFLDLNQPSQPVALPAQSAGWPVCQANRAAVLKSTPPAAPRLLAPTFSRTVLELEED